MIAERFGVSVWIILYHKDDMVTSRGILIIATLFIELWRVVIDQDAARYSEIG